MTAHETILAGLTNLLKKGALAKTACGAALLGTLQPVLQAGVVVEERSGGGRRLVVRDETAFRQFLQRNYPDTPVDEDDASRAAGVARFRDSKTFASDTSEIVSVRAWSEEALLKDGEPAGAARASSAHGVFSFLLIDHYSLHGACALVENPALFSQFERLRLPVGLVICSGRGHASGRMVDWLGRHDAPDFSLLHLPDYDPVGMEEFTRFRARLGGRVRLHLPDDLAQRFARFSSRDILEKARNQRLLANLRGSALADVRRVVSLIDRHNACLEQEALLLAVENPAGGG